MSRAAPLLVALLLALAPATASAAEPRTSLPDIEDEVMCVSCDVPLYIAESPQAYRQREYIRTLVAQGLTKDEVKTRLVAEYGQDVLAMPDEEGFGIAAYVVPIAVVGGLVLALALLLPRWRRRPRAATAGVATAGGPAATDAELRRLDDELRRDG